MKLIPPTSIQMLATCQQCGLEQTIPGTDQTNCHMIAAKQGWKVDVVKRTELCPTCAENARVNPPQPKALLILKPDSSVG